MWLTSTWTATSTSGAATSHKLGIGAPVLGLALRTLDALLYVWVGYALTLLLRCAPKAVCTEVYT
jgi:hypothetical protein